jgi:hypothetical protein
MFLADRTDHLRLPRGAATLVLSVPGPHKEAFRQNEVIEKRYSLWYFIKRRSKDGWALAASESPVPVHRTAASSARRRGRGEWLLRPFMLEAQDSTQREILNA